MDTDVRMLRSSSTSAITWLIRLLPLRAEA
jgi:hypothetical protein